MSAEHASRFELDALRIGELAPARAGELRAHLATCARCARIEAELTEGAAEFARTFDPAALAAQALAAHRHGRPASWGRRFGRALALAAPLAAAVVLAAIVEPERWERDALRSKGPGGALVEVFLVERSGDVRRVAAGEAVPAPGHLRVRFDPGGRAFARFYWESTPGRIESLYPVRDAPALAVSGSSWLEREVELDEVTGIEHLHAVFCDRPFDHASAVGVASGGGPDTGCTAVRVAIAKVRAP